MKKQKCSFYVNTSIYGLAALIFMSHPTLASPSVEKNYSPLVRLSQPYPIQEGKHLNQDEYSANWGLAAINADAAYKIGITGQGVKVGIVDTGVALAHPEFSQSARLTGLTVVLPGYLHLLLPELYPSNIDAVSRGDISLTENHGTHVGGIIAASKNNIGMHGVAYGSELISASTAFRDALSPKQENELSELLQKQIDELNKDNGPEDSLKDEPAIIAESKAKRFITQQLLPVLKASGAQIINNSWGSPSSLKEATLYWPEILKDQIIQGIVDIAKQGTLQVWAAGNHGRPDPALHAFLPHFMPELEAYWLTVVATDRNNQIADLSNYCGITANWCLAAPGVEISSSVNNNGYRSMSGTSMAAPHVTGAIALAMQRFPYMDNKQIREVILTTANNTEHLSNTAIYGQGLLDVAKAMQGPGKFRQDWIANLPNNPCAGLIDQTCNVWSNDISGPGALTKTGEGTLTLSGNNTYSGTTHVQAGQLNVTGQIQHSRALQVDHGATLRGTGFIHSPTTIAGILAPGNSAGTLTFSAPLTMTAGSQTQLDIDGIGTASGAGHYSRVVGQNTVTLGGRLLPRLRGIEGQATNVFTPAVGNRFAAALSAQGGFVGGFDALVQPDGLVAGSRFDVLFQGNQADLAVASSTLPGSMLGDNAAAGAQVLNALRDTPMALRPGAYNTWLGQATVGGASDVTYRAIGGQIYADSLAWGMAYQDGLGQVLFDRLAGFGSGKTAYTPGYALWMEVPYRRHTYSASPSRLDTQAGFGGVLLGLDRQFERLQVGAAFGVVDGRVKQDVARVDLDGYSFSVYGRYGFADGQPKQYLDAPPTDGSAQGSAPGSGSRTGVADAHAEGSGAYVVGRLSYVALNARSQRSLSAMTTTLNGGGQYHHASAELGIGSTWSVQQWQVNPELRLQHTHSHGDGVEESGVNPNDPFALTVDGLHRQRTSVRAQLRTSRRITLDQGYLTPQVMVGVQRRLGATPTSTARLSNLAAMYGNAGPWSIQQSAAVDERTLFSLGLGVQWQQRLWSAKAHVNATTSSLRQPFNADSKSLGAGLQVVRWW